MMRDQTRLEAARHIAEALGVSMPQAPQMGQPGAPQTGAPQTGAPQPAPLPPQLRAPPPGAPQGALGMTAGMPAQRPAMSPLQAVPSFRSPPMQAALQGAEGIKGHPALNQPVGFARGGLVRRGLSDA